MQDTTELKSLAQGPSQGSLVVPGFDQMSILSEALSTEPTQ